MVALAAILLLPGIVCLAYASLAVGLVIHRISR